MKWLSTIESDVVYDVHSVSILFRGWKGSVKIAILDSYLKSC